MLYQTATVMMASLSTRWGVGGVFGRGVLTQEYITVRRSYIIITLCIVRENKAKMLYEIKENLPCYWTTTRMNL